MIGSFGLLGGIASAATGTTNTTTCTTYSMNCPSGTTSSNTGTAVSYDPCLTPTGQLVAPSTNPLCHEATTQAASGTATATAPFTEAASSSGGLAFTGADVVGTIVLGLVLIGGGVVIVRVSRRRTQS